MNLKCCHPDGIYTQTWYNSMFYSTRDAVSLLDKEELNSLLQVTTINNGPRLPISPSHSQAHTGWNTSMLTGSSSGRASQSPFRTATTAVSRGQGGSRAAQLTDWAQRALQSHAPTSIWYPFSAHHHSQWLRRSKILVLANIGRESCTHDFGYTFLFFLHYSVFVIFTCFFFSKHYPGKVNKEATDLGMCLTLLRCWQQGGFCVLATLLGSLIKLERALSQLMHNWLVIH